MAEQDPNLSRDTRQGWILVELDTHGECGVGWLARRFGVSGMTIRRDLQALAEDGRVIRTHGGAAPTARVSFEFRFLEHAGQQRRAKEAIAVKAAQFIEPGQSVMLDSGTTTLAVARRLRGKAGLTVITTSLPIASELCSCDGVALLLLGGLLRHDSPDLTGSITESNLESLHADAAFLGADGIDAKGNVYSQAPVLARMLGKMAAAAERVYVVADHSKLGEKALMRFGNLGRWNGLITDAGADRALLTKLRRSGVRVIKA